VGDCSFEVVRELRNLSLQTLRVNGQDSESNEQQFQQTLLAAAGLSAFEDWILLLRYLTFFFEDRRSLVWDVTAQRQILQRLFLPPAESAQATSLEREVLSKDSHVRNLQAALSKEETILVRQERSQATRSDLESRISALTQEQDEEQTKLDRLQEDLAEIDAERQMARLEALRAGDDREAAYRAIERIRLEELHAAFPSESESAAYILGYLLSGNTCLVCGAEASAAALALSSRIDAHRCVICNSHVQENRPRIRELPSDADDPLHVLQLREGRLAEANKRRADAETVFRDLITQISLLEASIAERSAMLGQLISRLPATHQQVRDRRKEYVAMRGSLEVRRNELAEARQRYNSYIEQVNQTILARRGEIKQAFDDFAHEFLLENCHLIWVSHKLRVGQMGERTEFGLFEVDMSASDSGSMVRRTRAEQVSESQRQFIDLAFRMALIAVAGVAGQGSLVIDAPESSLDAVFAPRAARVLMRFGVPETGNRLVITSNLVDGKLIPMLLSIAGVSSIADDRLLSLFDVASPTAAVKQLRSEYDAALRHVFDGSG
jgi:hypothetical protein